MIIKLQTKDMEYPIVLKDVSNITYTTSDDVKEDGTMGWLGFYQAGQDNENSIKIEGVVYFTVLEKEKTA